MFQTHSGIELNANLASVAGVTVVPDDATNVPNEPVAIQIAEWPVPAGVPHTREQIVAAVIHSLLRSTNSTEHHPLRIRIEGAKGAEARELEKFAGSYTSPSAKVPGSRVHVDRRGLPWVVFAPPTRDQEMVEHPISIIFIPFMQSLEASDNEAFALLPVISRVAPNKTPLDRFSEPSPLVYNHSPSGYAFSPEANALLRLQALQRMSVFVDEKGVTNASLVLTGNDTHPEILPDVIAATCHALVCSLRPSEENPMKLSISYRGGISPLMERLKNSKGWSYLPQGESSHSFEATFHWDEKLQSPAGAEISGWKLKSTVKGYWNVVRDS